MSPQACFEANYCLNWSKTCLKFWPPIHQFRPLWRGVVVPRVTWPHEKTLYIPFIIVTELCICYAKWTLKSYWFYAYPIVKSQQQKWQCVRLAESSNRWTGGEERVPSASNYCRIMRHLLWGVLKGLCLDPMSPGLAALLHQSGSFAWLCSSHLGNYACH